MTRLADALVPKPARARRNLYQAAGWHTFGHWQDGRAYGFVAICPRGYWYDVTNGRQFPRMKEPRNETEITMGIRP